MKLGEIIFYLSSIAIALLANFSAIEYPELSNKLNHLWSFVLIAICIDFSIRLGKSIYIAFPIFIAAYLLWVRFSLPYHEFLVNYQHFIYLVMSLVFAFDLYKHRAANRRIIHFLILMVVAMLFSFFNFVISDFQQPWAIKMIGYGFHYYFTLAVVGKAILAYDLRATYNKSLERIAQFIVIWFANLLVYHLFQVFY